MSIGANNPMVSICVFAYNHEKYLARALDSVLSQEVNFPFEVIIAEDYSTDSTLQIARSYQALHPDIVRVEQSGQKVKLVINGHQTARYNLLNALRACRGKYIAFLDGDDYWLASDKLQRQVDYLELHPDCSFVFHNVYLEQSENQAELKQTYLSDTFPDNQNLRRLLVQMNYVPTSSVVFRNNVPGVFPKIFDTCMFGDWPLHIINLNFGNPKYMNEVMSVYKFGTGIWTSKKKVGQMGAILDYHAQVGEIMPKDILDLVPLALAKSHRLIAMEYLKEGRVVRFSAHSLMGAWHWIFGMLKSRRVQGCQEGVMLEKVGLPLNLVMLNTYDNAGGAAVATYRIHRGLRSIGVNSRLMVSHKVVDDPAVIGRGPRSILQRAIGFLYSKRDERITRHYRAKGHGEFSPARCPDKLAPRVSALNPDIVHLFWVNTGFMKIETLRQLKSPIVWTLHDMWPFTGGCHYDAECGKFRQSCGECPILGSASEHDLSRQVWQRKKESWRDVPIVVVATSHWLADMARSSSLFKNQRIEVIPNGIDTERYKPLDKRAAREAYGLPQDKHLVLFSAFSATSDKRKGNQFLVPALKKMASAGWGEKTELVVIGVSAPVNPPDLGMKIHYMGYLQDEISQVLLYSAADVTVAPSMQENLSNTVMESLACGTPVVAFNIGGMPDMIDHQGCGYLASPFASDDLAVGIMWVLENNERHAMLARQARKTVLERYTLKTVANQYLALYQDILK